MLGLGSTDGRRIVIFVDRETGARRAGDQRTAQAKALYRKKEEEKITPQLNFSQDFTCFVPLRTRGDISENAGKWSLDGGKPMEEAIDRRCRRRSDDRHRIVGQRG